MHGSNVLPLTPKISALPDELNGEYGGRCWIRTSVQLRPDLQSGTIGLSVKRPNIGGENGIRTHAPFSRPSRFQRAPLSHSGISPNVVYGGSTRTRTRTALPLTPISNRGPSPFSHTSFLIGGKTGIRTLVPIYERSDFESVPLVHSGIFPSNLN